MDMPLIVFQYDTGAQHSYMHETLMQFVRENENIVGIKMAHDADVPPYLRNVEALRQLDRHVAILPASGRVVHLLNLVGADWGVTGFPYFVAEEIVEMFDAAKAGDTVRVLEAADSIRTVAKIIASDPFYYMHQCYKEVTRILGRIPNALVRLPPTCRRLKRTTKPPQGAGGNGPHQAGWRLIQDSSTKKVRGSGWFGSFGSHLRPSDEATGSVVSSQTSRASRCHKRAESDSFRPKNGPPYLGITMVESGVAREGGDGEDAAMANQSLYRCTGRPPAWVDFS